MNITPAQLQQYLQDLLQLCQDANQAKPNAILADTIAVLQKLAGDQLLLDIISGLLSRL